MDSDSFPVIPPDSVFAEVFGPGPGRPSGYDGAGNYFCPIGCVFCPTPYEIIDYYLWGYIMGHPISFDDIKQINMQALDPNTLPVQEFKRGNKRNEAYYLTQLERQYTLRPLLKRITTTGYWEAIGSRMQVIYEKEIVGFQQKFVFYEGKPTNGIKTNWIIHEYKLNPGYIPDEELKTSSIMEKVETFAICSIRKEEEEEEEEEKEKEEEEEKEEVPKVEREAITLMGVEKAQGKRKAKRSETKPQKRSVIN